MNAHLTVAQTPRLIQQTVLFVFAIRLECGLPDAFDQHLPCLWGIQMERTLGLQPSCERL